MISAERQSASLDHEPAFHALVLQPLAVERVAARLDGQEEDFRLAGILELSGGFDLNLFAEGSIGFAFDANAPDLGSTFLIDSAAGVGANLSGRLPADMAHLFGAGTGGTGSPELVVGASLQSTQPLRGRLGFLELEATSSDTNVLGIGSAAEVTPPALAPALTPALAPADDPFLSGALLLGLDLRGPGNGGAIDPTTSAAPAGAAVGDVYLASSSGIALASWTGIDGAEIAQGDLLLFDGSNWSANAALGPDGAGVIRIQVAAPLSVDESDPAQPLLSVEPATTAAAGVLRLAAAEDLTAGTEGAAVDAAALKEAMATAQPAGDYMPLDLSTLPALP